MNSNEITQEQIAISAKIRHYNELIFELKFLNEALWYIEYFKRECEQELHTAKFNNKTLAHWESVANMRRKKIEVLESPAPHDLIVDNEVS